ncbi:MAG: ribbon-helix-helix protein, CopG family [Actinobacteria bacterium]|nr:ribbon-helix-helix protein, CopG family [Actinomycetota bacterium]
MAMVTVRLSDDLKARIDNLAEKSGRPKSYFIRELILRGIEEFEEDLRDLEAIREYLAAGGRNQKMISMKDLSIELGLDKLDSENNSTSRKTTKKASQTSRPKTAKPAASNSRKRKSA